MLEYIHPDRLREWWDAIRPGIEAVRGNIKEDWIAEDVFHAIKSGASILHIGTVDGDYAGFIVVTPTSTEFSKERVLHVWLAFSTGDYDVWDPAMAELRKIGQTNGFSAITCCAMRRGHERKGFDLKHITYETRL